MKILFVGDIFGGGKERRMCELIRFLCELNIHDLYLLTTKLKNVDYPYVLQCVKGYYELQTNCSRKDSFRQIKTYIKDIQPDVVHSWHTYQTYQIALLRPFLPKFRFIAGFVADGNKEGSGKEQIRTWVSCLMSNIVVSNSWAGIASHKVPKWKSVVIYNGFNPKRIPSDDVVNRLRGELQLGYNHIVSMAARMDRMKDFHTFINAIKILNERVKNVKFLFCGKGEMEEEYRKRIEKEAIENIIFLGFRKDVEVIYKMSDVSVLCSAKIHHEGVSNSIMESMAMGTPVIATRSGGTPEIIEDGVNGYIIEPEDAIELANKIEKLLYSEELRSRFSIAAKKTIEGKFTIAKMVDEYQKLYDKSQKGHK